MGAIFAFYLCFLAIVSALAPPEVLTPVHVNGKYFFTENGRRFFIKGVAYQRNEGPEVVQKGFIDSLADPYRCRRDVELLKQLNVNTVRAYAIDPNANHDACMSMLENANIYVIADLATPEYSINREFPSWNVDLRQKYEKTVDNLQKYRNLLAFIAGNEVITSPMTSKAAPILRAAIRDTRNYIKAKGYRHIPVGYATDDHDLVRPRVEQYLMCGDKSSRPEFLGINMYSWCGDSSYEKSGYEERVNEVSDFDIPVIASEFGCNLIKPRAFSDVDAFYSEDMTEDFSGAIAYMYFQERNDFGLVEERGNDVVKLADFQILQQKFSTIQPTLQFYERDYEPFEASIKCPKNNKLWSATLDLPDTPDPEDCKCMVQTLGCIANPAMSKAAMRELFGIVCGMDGVNCNAIISDGQNPGMYGPWAQCGDRAKLSWAMNDYYRNHGSTPRVCHFDGQGLVQPPTADDKCYTKVQLIENFIPDVDLKPWMKNSYRFHKFHIFKGTSYEDFDDDEDSAAFMQTKLLVLAMAATAGLTLISF